MNYNDREKYDEILEKYVQEYLTFGKELGLFKTNEEIEDFNSRF